MIISYEDGTETNLPDWHFFPEDSWEFMGVEGLSGEALLRVVLRDKMLPLPEGEKMVPGNRVILHWANNDDPRRKLPADKKPPVQQVLERFEKDYIYEFRSLSKQMRGKTDFDYRGAIMCLLVKEREDGDE